MALRRFSPVGNEHGIIFLIIYLNVVNVHEKWFGLYKISKILVAQETHTFKKLIIFFYNIFLGLHNKHSLLDMAAFSMK